MKVGIVKYLNALPFHISLNTNDLHITFGHPSEINSLWKEQKIDCALTSSNASFQENIVTLPFGIACNGPVLSVNLYLSKKIEDSTILLPKTSATSIKLLKILCHHFWKVSPRFVEAGAHDGALLIGDEALQKYRIPKMKKIDLGKAWKEATGLPFVFAIFMGRPGCDMEALSHHFDFSLSWSEQNQNHLLTHATKLSNLPEALLKRYFRTLIYRLGEGEFQGLNLFKELGKDVHTKRA